MGIDEVYDTIYRLVEENCPEQSNPVDFVTDIVRPLSIRKLSKLIDGCAMCSISNGCKGHTSLKANGGESVLMIGENMLEEQIQTEGLVMPFSEAKRETEIMERIMAAYSVNTEAVAWMNVVNCFPFQDIKGEMYKRPPTQKELECCKPYIDFAIRSLRPQLIILLGNVALNAFRKANVKDIHGEWINVYGVRAMAVYSPSFIAELERNCDSLAEEYKLDFQDDLLKAFRWVRAEYPDWDIVTKDI